MMTIQCDQFCNREILTGYYVIINVPSSGDVKKGFPEMSRGYSSKEVG